MKTPESGFTNPDSERRGVTLLFCDGATAVGPRGADVLGMLSLAVGSKVPVGDLVDMIYTFPTFYGGVGEALGAYERGIGKVLDPETEPMFTD